ncbi:MAG: hypothetical protein IT292_02970 [Deltaproteobacteria bacterium]|nr:hypothetical protein [Deltaproteobacteria bacterium]
MSVNYTGSSAIVSYNLDAPYFLSETHVYAGNAPLPVNNGSYTVAPPGQYPYIHGDWNAINSRPNSDSFNVSDISGSIYYIAHASVCGFPLQ